MSRIKVLSQDTINKIAAGEVIERPMAVVKELVENSIDAGANSVTVEIRDGGKNLIRITDNGCGISNDDIELAFTPHATSKIKDANDLLAVSTLGFRGEALASIASVSQLEMVTKTREGFSGYRYLTDGGEKKSLEEVGCPEGTTFIIRNIFYNTPARLKFLKTSQTEAGYIGSTLERMALSHPEVSFRFINQNQPKMHTSGNGSLKDVIYQIYGRDIASNLIEISAVTPNCKITGFIGKPVISRGNRAFINYFINGRYIKSSVIHQAIENAYSPYTMQHRYPFAALHFTVNPEYLDVNVHPQKMEIRFTNEKELFSDIFHTLEDALKGRELIPEVTFGKEENKKTDKKELINRKQDKTTYETKNSEQNLNDLGVNDNTHIKEVNDKNLSGDLVEGNVHLKKPSTDDLNSFFGRQDKIKSLKSDLPWQDNNHINMEFAEPRPIYGNKQENLFDTGILSDRAKTEVQIIGQVFSTYWVLQYNDKMYLVDQHAAHEKVLYERFMKQIKEKEPQVQFIKPPIVLTLSMREGQVVEENIEVFEKMGYLIEHFGGREYVVNGVPAQLPTIATEGLLLGIIDDLVMETGKNTPDILLERMASMSCKAAVKGNKNLPYEQAKELLTELMTLENPYNCPHGRPTMICMTKREIEKKFKRIG